MTTRQEALARALEWTARADEASSFVHDAIGVDEAEEETSGRIRDNALRMAATWLAAAKLLPLEEGVPRALFEAYEEGLAGAHSMPRPDVRRWYLERLSGTEGSS